ncbi:hypothetical protein C5E08_03185 [Rathayibacter iranicus]|uniref:Uncharacterized protein n=1 Tax=Rathayibacter iranicus NCPPB 2253 = VKM Ac-1602 TaxID=1328868 RepID=A0ABX5L845_9MICO|nr:hypothetical protein C5E08_03185 [Rathayibacter iranicus]PWJ60829.1 hypothetical protein B0H03_12428 [Rathayibacter iranicus NCPPB 2253 = VKM Ac-1602]
MSLLSVFGRGAHPPFEATHSRYPLSLAIQLMSMLARQPGSFVSRASTRSAARLSIEYSHRCR